MATTTATTGAAGGVPAKRFSREHTTYWFDPRAQPVYDVEPGTRCVVETLDAASGRLQTYDDLAPYLAWRNLERAKLRDLRHQAVILTLAAVAPIHAIWLAEGGDFVHPGFEFRVLDLVRHRIYPPPRSTSS